MIINNVKMDKVLHLTAVCVQQPFCVCTALLRYSMSRGLKIAYTVTWLLLCYMCHCFSKESIYLQVNKHRFLVSITSACGQVQVLSLNICLFYLWLVLYQMTNSGIMSLAVNGEPSKALAFKGWPQRRWILWRLLFWNACKIGSAIKTNSLKPIQKVDRTVQAVCIMCNILAQGLRKIYSIICSC